MHIVSMQDTARGSVTVGGWSLPIAFQLRLFSNLLSPIQWFVIYYNLRWYIYSWAKSFESQAVQLNKRNGLHSCFGELWRATTYNVLRRRRPCIWHETKIGRHLSVSDRKFFVSCIVWVTYWLPCGRVYLSHLDKWWWSVRRFKLQL